MLIIAMIDDSMILINLRVQSLMKGPLPNIANISVELNAVTPSSILCCHHQSCYPIESTPYKIRPSSSAQ
jgi:hypothetical protein